MGLMQMWDLQILRGLCGRGFPDLNLRNTSLEDQQL